LAEHVLEVGIDEAGYAPRLGPLVVTGVAIARPRNGRDLYEILAPAVSRELEAAGDGPRPLVIGDSKEVYGSKKRLDELERGALAFLTVATRQSSREETRPSNDLALARGLDAGGLDLSGLEWYAGGPTRLPVAADAADVEGSAGRLERALAAAGARDLAIRSRIVTARELNEAIARGLNKAEYEVELVAGLMGSLCDVATRGGVDGPALGASVLVDRLGGRTNYLPLLEAAFPGARRREVAKTKIRSSYAVEDPEGRRRASVAFACRAEALSMLVALASMVSKYVRELFMKRLNRWFAARLPGLKPTAGYPVDGARFLADTARFRARAGIADEDLVRSR
jgi:hypothetical protein